MSESDGHDARGVDGGEQGVDASRRRLLLSAAGAAVASAALVPGQAGAAASAATSVSPARAASGTRRCTLYPHPSPTRTSRDLSGLWKFRLDPADEGERLGWFRGLTDTRTIPVPASWNEIFDDARNYFGSAWYQTEFYAEEAWQGRRVVLRFGSANYRAKAWLNGTLLGEHVGGHLPFEFEVSGQVRSGENVLVVLVENVLREDRVPAASPPSTGFAVGGYPGVTFDFFPYCGLHRPVHVYTTPLDHLEDLTVVTGLDGGAGLVDVDLVVAGGWSGRARVTLDGGGTKVTTTATIRGGRGRARLRIDEVRPWSPDDPFLYRLSVETGSGATRDLYAMKIGVRTVAVRGDQFLLNGKPVFLKGFGKHEDFAISGRGLNLPVLARDFELLKWINANSFRTSHYPYSDEAMMLADQYGMLVVAETPAVSLAFDDSDAAIEARRAQLAHAIDEMIARDKNHACVVLWSIANEPGISLGLGTTPPDRRKLVIDRGTRFFAPLFEQARRADPSRPVALVSVGNGPDEWVGLGDVICTNLYYGWYYGGLGQLDVAAVNLAKELTRLHDLHRKPVLLTEFGADTIAGVHAQPSEMWSEEYQAEMMAMVMEVVRRHGFVIGAHPWAFADFRTSQGILRAAGINHKGVFTRERRPKMAAHQLKELWAPGAAAPVRS